MSGPVQYDAWDYRLLEQADGEGMYYRAENYSRMTWEQAADEAVREQRPCTYPLSLNRTLDRVTDTEA